MATPANYELSSIVSKLNRLLFNTTNGEHYVTFFYATFDQNDAASNVCECRSQSAALSSGRFRFRVSPTHFRRAGGGSV